MNDTKLVITGISSISSLGIGYDAVSSGLTATPAPVQVRAFEFHELDRETSCFRVADFAPAEILGKKGLRTKDLATKLLLATMELGFKERFESEPLERKPGIVVGTSFGSVQSIGDFLSDSIVNGVNAVNPMHFANTVINSPTGNANIRYAAKQLSTTVSTGSNSGIDAIIYACDHIRSGYLPAIVTGGLEEISYYVLMGMERSGLLSPGGVIKPFAADADGTVMGEGCTLFMVETEESAKAHGAPVIAEIAGYCNVFDPGNGVPGFNPDGEGATFSIREALGMARIDPDRIDFIVSGANGIAGGDAMIARVLTAEFGDKPVAAYKAKTGDCYGGSSALNCACALADMQYNRVSGTGTAYTTINGVNLVSETIQNKESEYILVTEFSCEGNCSSVVLKNV